MHHESIRTELPVFQIKEMMERAGNSRLLTVLSYPNAGHLIEPPYTPHARSSNFRTVTEGKNIKCKFTLPVGEAMSD